QRRRSTPAADPGGLPFLPGRCCRPGEHRFQMIDIGGLQFLLRRLFFLPARKHRPQVRVTTVEQHVLWGNAEALSNRRTNPVRVWQWNEQNIERRDDDARYAVG